MKTETIVRKWGSSLGVIIPREIVREENIELNDKIEIKVRKKFDISELFGTLKMKKSGQEIKDEMRKGWEPEH